MKQGLEHISLVKINERICQERNLAMCDVILKKIQNF